MYWSTSFCVPVYSLFTYWFTAFYVLVYVFLYTSLCLSKYRSTSLCILVNVFGHLYLSIYRTVSVTTESELYLSVDKFHDSE